MSFENLDDFLQAQSDIGYADHLASQDLQTQLAAAQARIAALEAVCREVVAALEIMPITDGYLLQIDPPEQGMKLCRKNTITFNALRHLLDTLTSAE